MFNFGGPGWFADVLNLSIQLDGPYVEEDGENFIIPWHRYKGRVVMCDTRGKLTGKLIAVAPPSHKIWHNGVKVIKKIT